MKRKHTEQRKHTGERRSRPHRSYNVDCEKQDGDRSEEETFTLNCMEMETSIQRTKPFEVTMEVNKKTLHFEIDTSIMNEMKFNEVWNEKQRPPI